MSTDPPHAHVLLGSRRTLRVLKVRRGRFLEFEFTVDHEDLTVELVMPWPELLEFAAENEAEWLAPEPDAVPELRRLAHHHGNDDIFELMTRAPARTTNPTAGGQP